MLSFVGKQAKGVEELSALSTTREAEQSAAGPSKEPESDQQRALEARTDAESKAAAAQVLYIEPWEETKEVNFHSHLEHWLQLKQQRRVQGSVELIFFKLLIDHRYMRVLIDNGLATNLFFSPNRIRKAGLGMKQVELENPCQTQVGNQEVVTSTHAVKGVRVTFDKDRTVTHELNFYILDKCPFDAVIGLGWITKKNAHPLPRIDDRLDVAGGWKVFSKIDLKSGYHQIEVDPNDQHKTAFRTCDGLYEFIVMPFGLTNAPATFQCLMDKVLRHQLNMFVVVYLNDILIFSKSMEEHVKHLEEVLQVLKEAQLHLNLEKYELGRDNVVYLGHRLSANGLEPEATKVEVIRKWPQSANVRELRSFLGLASYYRKFVPKFSVIAHPLS
ncbi:hypothetical protein CBR_g40988 [Chara braunii]|uniref:Reverse transcriptase domain-containing protein n=1 Tax=Chara braunii TaxID=69332 RepID=A0A388LUZ8_CHABU|nr:hypothetical protein CBR_g40988 [Chara braunii]|eukprot:GBG86085.1 hypothetical protein CBR_g40988 [Chara braunii]